MSRALTVGLVLLARSATAQWSQPRPIFTSAGHVHNPIAVADAAGTVHVFFVEHGKESSRLFYLRRDAGGWSEPIVVLAPTGRVEFPSAAIDPHGWMHVVYAGPSAAQLEYRRVHVSRSTDPDAWSRPQRLTDSGVFSSHVIATPDGALHLVYARRDGNVFYTHSADGGRTWASAVAVSAVDSDREAANGPDIAVDGRGRLHVVWTQFELPRGWPPARALYSRSVDGGHTWSPAREMAGANHGLITIAAHGPDEVHAVWNATAQIGDRDHAWSGDGGEIWTASEHITTQIRGGWTGAATPVFDSAGALHLITSVDGPRSIERIFHLTRSGTQWSDPEFASDGTVADDSVEFPSVAISGGNHLHVVYEVDYRQIWYTDRTVDAPASPPAPIPTLGTDLGSKLTDASPSLRILLAVIAIIVVALPIELAWQRVHWRAR
jgi:hypothetical protein